MPFIPIQERLKDKTPEERAEMARKGQETRKKNKKKKKQTQAIVAELLGLRPYIDKKTEQALEQVGYDVETMGIPTLETLALLKVVNNATLGDIQSLETLYKYGMVPDMQTQLKREALKVEREKMRGGDTSQNYNNMTTIAELINNPQPNINIDDIEIDRLAAPPPDTGSNGLLPGGDDK